VGTGRVRARKRYLCLSDTLRYINTQSRQCSSPGWLGLRKPMDLCACVSEERGSRDIALLGAIFRTGAGSLGKAFIITEKTRAREELRRCRCYEGQGAKA
jgi:hypothetical protein